MAGWGPLQLVYEPSPSPFSPSYSLLRSLEKEPMQGRGVEKNERRGEPLSGSLLKSLMVLNVGARSNQHNRNHGEKRGLPPTKGVEP